MNFSSKSEIFTNSTAYKVTSSESNHFWHLLYQESEQFLKMGCTQWNLSGVFRYWFGLKVLQTHQVLVSLFWKLWPYMKRYKAHKKPVVKENQWWLINCKLQFILCSWQTLQHRAFAAQVLCGLCKKVFSLYTNFQWAVKPLVPKTGSDFLSLAWILTEFKAIKAAPLYFYRI